MHQGTQGDANVANIQAADDALGQHLHATASEAAERVNFHRIELERWERVGRSAQLGLAELERTTPVAHQAPDGFLGDQPRPTGNGVAWS